MRTGPCPFRIGSRRHDLSRSKKQRDGRKVTFCTLALVFATGTKLLTGRKICCPFMLSPGPTPLIFDFFVIFVKGPPMFRLSGRKRSQKGVPAGEMPRTTRFSILSSTTSVQAPFGRTRAWTSSCPALCIRNPQNSSK